MLKNFTHFPHFQFFPKGEQKKGGKKKKKKGKRKNICAMLFVQICAKL